MPSTTRGLEMALDFDLEIPDTEEIKQEITQELAVPPQRAELIDNTAQKKGDQIMNIDLDNVADRRSVVAAIEGLGMEETRKSTRRNEILGTRVRDLSQGGGEGGAVANDLAALSMKMRDLDPSGIDFMKKGPLGGFFNPVRRYFEKYKSADAEIADIVKSLDKGKRTLQNDNKTLQLEADDMRQLTKDLNQRIAMAIDLDAYLTDQVEQKNMMGDDPELVKFVEEEVLFPLRQRIQDLQQLQLVNQQGILAMDVVRRNNMELIRAVNRAQSVTVASLRVAVTVAGALYNQQIVLEKINALNETTNNMIAATSQMLKQQGVAIQQQATSTAVSPETLKKAFEDTFEALDDISNYRRQALPQMAETIATFREMADEGESRLQQMEAGDANTSRFLN